MQSRYREVCGQLQSPHLFTGHTPDSMRTFSMLEWNWNELPWTFGSKRGMYMWIAIRFGVVNQEPFNSLQLKHEGFPFPLPYRRIVLKPRSEKWGRVISFFFLGLNQTAILTTEQNPKGCKSMNKFNPLISCMLLFQEKESAEWGKGQRTTNKCNYQKNMSHWQSSSNRVIWRPN